MEVFRVALKRYIAQGYAAPEAMKKVWRDIRAGSVARPVRGKRRRKRNKIGPQKKRAAMKATARGIELNPRAESIAPSKRFSHVPSDELDFATYRALGKLEGQESGRGKASGVAVSSAKQIRAVMAGEREGVTPFVADLIQRELSAIQKEGGVPFSTQDLCRPPGARHKHRPTFYARRPRELGEYTYCGKLTRGNPSIHLQGIGRVPAKAYGELVAGDRIVFNYGYSYQVLRVTPRGAGSVALVIRSERDGSSSEIKRRRSTLIGYAGRASSANPGAGWHRREAAFSREMGKKRGGKISTAYYAGAADAHETSGRVSRAKGINPRPSRGKPVVVYDRLMQLRATKGSKSHYPGQRFYHRFSTPAKVMGMPDGSLRIVGRRGQRLWGTFAAK